MINLFRQVRAIGASVGAVLFNSTSGGTPSSDPNFYWDAANHNLGIGVTDVNAESSTPFNSPNIVEIGPSTGGGAGAQNAVLLLRGDVTGFDNPVGNIPFLNKAYSAGVNDRRIAEIRASRQDADGSGALELWTADAGTLSQQMVVNRSGRVDFLRSVAYRATPLTVANGLNSNISLAGEGSYVRLAGPTGFFSIDGIAGGVDGMRVIFRNVTPQQLTIVNSNTSVSSSSNFIYTMTGANVIQAAGHGAVFEVIYEIAVPGWILLSHNP